MEGILTHPVQNVSSGKRFDVKTTSDMLMILLFDLIRRLAEMNGFRLARNTRVEFSYDCGEVETSSRNGKFRMRTKAECHDELLDFVEDLGGIQIDISVRVGDHFSMDADFVRDGSDRSDLGGVDARITLPNDFCTLTDQEVRKITLMVRGLFAHELQHVVQFVILGYTLRNDSILSLRKHACDRYEIEARTEEIIATLEDGMDDIISFRTCLEEYVEKYLTRNGLSKTDSQFVTLQGKMIYSHMKQYDKRSI